MNKKIVFVIAAIIILASIGVLIYYYSTGKINFFTESPIKTESYRPTAIENQPVARTTFGKVVSIAGNKIIIETAVGLEKMGEKEFEISQNATIYEMKDGAPVYKSVYKSSNDLRVGMDISLLYSEKDGDKAVVLSIMIGGQWPEI